MVDDDDFLPEKYSDIRELALLRAKLEKRTLFLRALLAYAIAMSAGLLVHFLANCR